MDSEAIVPCHARVSRPTLTGRPQQLLLAHFRKRRSGAMAEGGPGGKRPRRASARLVAAAAESALPPLLRFLDGDPLRAVAKLLPDAALTCF
jgi:hypothetical protein